MALKIENITEGKMIGIGDVTILPGESAVCPQEYETSPILEVYKKAGQIRVTGKPSTSDAEEKAVKKTVEEVASEAETTETEMSSEEVASEANKLGINPADCMDEADVKKAVKAAKSSTKKTK